jgi:hypothetical protein
MRDASIKEHHKWEHREEDMDIPSAYGFGLADWKDPPHDVLEVVDAQLREYGFEIAVVDTKSDQYAWLVVPLGVVPAGVVP